MKFTVKTIVNSPKFLMWKFSGDSTKTMQKLCLSTEFPQQEIRWNYSILRNDSREIIGESSPLHIASSLTRTFGSRAQVANHLATRY